MNEIMSVFLIKMVLPRMYRMQNLPRIFFFKRFQRIKIFPETGQTDRNDRKTLHLRIKILQIADRLIQCVSVIEALAQYDLPVHADARIGKLSQLPHQISREPVMQHELPKLRIRRLNGNIHGLHVIADHALKIRILHIRQCDIVAL